MGWIDDCTIGGGTVRATARVGDEAAAVDGMNGADARALHGSLKASIAGIAGIAAGFLQGCTDGCWQGRYIGTGSWEQRSS